MMEERQAMEGYAQLDIFVLKDQKHHFSAQLVNIVLFQSWVKVWIVKKAIIALETTQNTSQDLVHKGITAPKERYFHTSSLVHLEHIITEHGEQRSRIVSVAPRDNIAPLKVCW